MKKQITLTATVNHSNHLNRSTHFYSWYAKWLATAFLSLLFVIVGNLSFGQKIDSKLALIEKNNEAIASLDLEYLIQGVVVDENEEPLPGINVFLKDNTSVGTITDADGKFTFPQKLELGDVLVFKFVGFQDQEYTVPESPEDNIEIQMETYTEILVALDNGEVYEEKTSGINRVWSKIKGLF